MKTRLALCSGALIGALLPAAAQTYPSKPVALIVPFAAGGNRRRHRLLGCLS